MNSDNELTVFISHKLNDREAAEMIKDELGVFGVGRLKFFLSEEIPFGENWTEKIHDSLKTADWLILLYTDPTADWDWCLYETGFFAAKIIKEENRLICLHSPKVPLPKPLEKWQAVNAVEADVVKLLKQIYGEPPHEGVEPINSQLADDENRLKDIAEKIINVIGPRPEEQHYNNYMILSLESEQVKRFNETGEIPDGALIISDDNSLDMFGLRSKVGGNWTWGELKEVLSENEQTSWAKQLEITMLAANRSRTFSPSLSSFLSPKDEKLYHPVLHWMDIMPNQSRKFKFIFIKAPTEETPRLPGNLGLIYGLLVMTKNFRWGVITVYPDLLQKLIDKKASAEEIDECLANLNSALIKVEREVKKKGVIKTADLLPAFSDEDREMLKKMGEPWENFKRELKKNIDEKNLKEIIKILSGFRENNKNFMVLVARRFRELLTEME